ncbi:MAG TPA: AAA family ATPase [Caldilineae bacterium]|nr:AAA family ATPase [Caldilineae bacterium]
MTIPRRQTRALLYCLAVHLEPLPREQICFLFWPHTPEATARANLSRLLNYLRQALPDSHLILTGEDQVGLDPGRVWSDTKAWTDILKASSTSSSTDALQHAVTLYRGPFLHGFSLPDRLEFENWLTRERQRWERLYLEALAALIEAKTKLGAYKEAIAHALRYLEIDELAEDMHCRLIQLYAAIGDRSAALRQFERCATVLERELGVSPLPETRAAYQAVLEGRPMAPRPLPAPTWTTLPSLEAPLVGRDKALGSLQRAYARARGGRGSVVLISGEPGIGKSRLLQEFIGSLELDTLVMVAGGHPAEQGLPYWPLVEALRPHLPTVDWAALSIDPIYLAEVARLLPELHTALPELRPPASVELGQEQARLFRALSDLILALATHRPPLVLSLDDLHWTDEATRSWLGYLGRCIKHAPVLILGAYRSEEADAVAALRAELARVGILQELPLEGLTEEEVLQLVRQLSGQTSGGEQFSRRLHRETGGNPFFLLEVLRTMFETGVLWKEESGWGTVAGETAEDYQELPLPDTIYQAIRNRLERLSPQARQVLEAGAVIGHRFDVDLVLATSGRHEEEVVEALDTLVARQVLLEQEGRYRFSHDLIRTVVYRDLGYGRRRLLHRRAGEALERLRSDDVVTLAWHFDRAGQVDKAIDYLLQAGDRARGLYAYHEAIRHYERALALQREQGDDEGAARTLMRLGLTHHIAFDFQKARQAYDEGFDLWQRAGAMPLTTPLPPAPHALRVDWPHLLTLDPAAAGDANSGGVIDQLFSGLVEWSPAMNVVPDVAHSWEVLEEGRQYLFHLREDRLWSDGRSVTAGDFEYAWKRAVHPASRTPFASLLFALKGAKEYHQGLLTDPGQVGVRALDEATLLVELEEPCSYFLHILAHFVARPVPRHMVEAHGEAWTAAQNLVTNGPFRLENWDWGRRVVLVRNSAYHGRSRGNVERVELYLLVDPGAKAAKLKMYEENQLDVLGLWWGIPPAQVARMLHDHGGEHISALNFFIRYLGFDVSRRPFADPRVRRAFAHATDRETLAHVTMAGYADPATGGFIPPGMPGHSPEIGLPYDPQRARSLLAAAGYAGGRGFPSVDWFTPQGFEAIAECLREQWRRVLGVEVRQEVLPWEEYVGRLHGAHQPHMFLAGWVADYPDPDSFLRASNHRQLTHWHHKDYEALVEKARRVQDQVQRMRMYREADHLLIQEAPLVPLVYARRSFLLKPWVRTYPASPLKWWFWKDVVLVPH